MKRTTIVFGNGLGMALNPMHFSLSAGLGSAWRESNIFSNEHKNLIISSLPKVNENTPPESENQLDQLQVALVAAEYLKYLNLKGASWLTSEASELPNAFQRYIHAVAAHFHAHNFSLPLDFTESLANFINKSKSHITTLNYDNLLYDGLKGRNIFNGYSGSLYDGYTNTGFSSENLHRRYPKNHAWYMHLHGSPLFIGKIKAMREERAIFKPDESSHIVLTHVKHKPLIIARSIILSTYWEKLPESISESDSVVLFGYSGEDTHLNRIISQCIAKKYLHVIEWQGNHDHKQREKYWKEKINNSKRGFTLELLENVLSFTNWEDL